MFVGKAKFVNVGGYQPGNAIAQCAFCGDDATQKAADNTPCCENCISRYKPKRGTT